MHKVIESKLTSLLEQCRALMGQTNKQLSPNAIIRAARHIRHTGSTRRLTDNEREQVVEMIRKNIPVIMIAKIFRISRPSVYNIRDAELPTLNRHNMTLSAGK